MTEQRPHVFVSYTQADRAWAEWIGWQLEHSDSGYDVVLQAWDFGAGGNFLAEMHRSVRDAERTLVVLSPDYMRSAFATAEWTAVFATDPIAAGRRLIPVRVADCAPEGLLAPLAYIDLVDLSAETARTRLLTEVRGAVRPTTEPAYPPQARARAMLSEPRFPDELPAVWEVPHRRNPYFTGRDVDLRQLENMLQDGPGVVTQSVAGLGGVGKTGLVVEYLYRRHHEFDVVWWIAAEDSATLHAQYAKLGARLGLPAVSESDIAASVEAVRRWLESEQRWLLVFDNAEDVDVLAALVPAGGRGRVLITTRGGTWDSLGGVLELDVLDEDNAVRFLLERSRQPDETAARNLARELGYLPLALEQAAAYLRQVRTLTLDDYLCRFHERSMDLLGRGRPRDRKDTVATCWSLSLDRVRSANPAAAELLTLFAFLAPDDIPLALISGGAESLPPSVSGLAGDSLTLADAIGALTRYSLVTVAGDGVNVHRLVQAVIRDALPVEKRNGWVECTASMLESAFPADPANDMTSWSTCQRLLPHSLSSAQHAQANDAALSDTSLLIDRCASFLRVRGQYREALVLLRRALTIDEDLLGPEHPNVASALGHLATTLRELGDASTARPLLERALTIDEAALGPDHPDLATTLGNLALVVSDLGEPAAARLLLERALTISEEALGPDHPDVATTLGNLALVVSDLGEPAAARPLLERALTISEEALGPDHPNVAATLGNLATVLRDLGEPAAARLLLERALTIDEAAFGPDHPNVATTLGNLATVLQASGPSAVARALLERALTINEAALGPEHPNVATDLGNLATVLQASGQPAAARPLLERALTINEAALGPEHPRVASALDNLAAMLQELDDPAAARPLLERALAIRDTALGRGHPLVAVSAYRLAFVTAQLGDLERAREGYARALSVDEAVYGPAHQEVAVDLEAFADIEERLGNTGSAAAALRRAIDIRLATDDDGSPLVIDLRERLQGLEL